jgi:hypothetical protein
MRRQEGNGIEIENAASRTSKKSGGHEPEFGDRSLQHAPVRLQPKNQFKETLPLSWWCERVVWRTAKTFHFGDLVGIPTKKAALAPEHVARNELQDEAECDQ